MASERITLFLVGVGAEDAASGLYFDSDDSAESYCRDNPGTHVFAVQGTMDLSTIAPVDEWMVPGSRDGKEQE